MIIDFKVKLTEAELFKLLDYMDKEGIRYCIPESGKDDVEKLIDIAYDAGKNNHHILSYDGMYIECESSRFSEILKTISKKGKKNA